MMKLNTVLIVLSLFSSPLSLVNNLNNSNDLIYEELMQDNNFAPHEYVTNKNIGEHQEFKGLLLHEHESNELIYYLFNVTGFKMINPDDTRIAMSINSNDYNHYSLEYLGNTNDFKFYKFKVKDYTIDASIEKREYNISEFECKQERVYENNEAIGLKNSDSYHASSINQSYTYTNDGYILKDLTSITLDVTSGYKRTFGTTSAELTWQYRTDINYIYFNTPKYLGDLIGIKLDFYKTTKIEHYETEVYPHGEISLVPGGRLDDGNIVEFGDLYNCCSLKSEEIKDGNNDKYYCIEYTSEDKETIIGSNGFNSFISNILNFSWIWGHEDIKDLKIIEKIDYAKLLSGSTDYYLSDKDYEYLINNPLDELLGETWLIRFDFSKFGLKGRGDHIVANKGGRDGRYTYKFDYITQITYDVEKSSYRDIDVITLTYSNDGKEYTLPVVSNTNNLTHGDENPSPLMPDWLKWLLRIFAIILILLILIPILPYVIQFIVWLILLPIKLIKEIIRLFKNKKKKR